MRRSMNILELCDFYSNYASNFIPSLINLESKLSEKGHKVFFIFSTKNLSKKFYEWEVPFSTIYKTELFDFTSYSIVKNVVDFIKKNDIKIVHGHFLASFYLSEIKKRCPKDVVFFEHIHSAPYNNAKTLKARLKRIRNVFLLNHRITKICVSDAIIPMTKYIYPCTKVVSCRNAIDLARLNKKNNNYLNEFSILLFGYNYFVKGVDIAIKAVMRYSLENNIHLDIVMSDNLESNKNQIIKDFGCIPDCVTILEPSHDVVPLYRSHQVFLNASRSEGISYAIVEAYYCGSLCVVSDVPATKETNLPDVIYFKAGSEESLYFSLKTAFEKRHTYENDNKYVEDNFSINKWSEELIKIFKLD